MKPTFDPSSKTACFCLAIDFRRLVTIRRGAPFPASAVTSAADSSTSSISSSSLILKVRRAREKTARAASIPSYLLTNLCKSTNPNVVGDRLTKRSITLMHPCCALPSLFSPFTPVTCPRCLSRMSACACAKRALSGRDSIPKVKTAKARIAFPPLFKSPAFAGAINIAEDMLLPPLGVVVACCPGVTATDAATELPCNNSH
eukprot:CCRYP_020481-RA/>CCRYP_020481-RA protein AED:0.12 eAED:0.12 QI:2607/1/1/1/1/1/2/1879/201